MRRHHGTGRLRVPRFCLAAFLVFVGTVGLGQPSGPAPPPPESQPAAKHQEVTLDLIQDYLKRWEVENTVVDRQDQHVRFKLKVSDRADPLDCLIQVKTQRDGQTFDRLYIGFLDLASVPAGNPRLLDVLKTLATLNWQNAIGKYSWDETDGEIRLEHAIVANEGLCYADFADVMHRLTLIANTDRPTIQRARWH